MHRHSVTVCVLNRPSGVIKVDLILLGTCLEH